MTILGIDPGTATVGYGIIEVKKKKELSCIGYGTIKTPSWMELSERLKRIEKEVAKIIRKYNPKIVAIEKLYFFKNVKTAISVSEARGVILLTASKKKIPILEFTPLEVKMSIVGYGKATKIQIQKMVKSFLNLKEIPKPDDAADALALALCAHFLLEFKKNT